MEHPKKILFVCSQNKLRSLTAERIYDNFPGYEVRSAGTQPDARVKVTEGILGWADLVFVMEKSHLNRIRRKFAEAVSGKRVVVLHIPDEYQYMEPALVDELCMKLSPYIEIPDVRGR